MSVTPSVHDGGMTDRPLGASTTGAPPNGGGIAGDGRCYDYEEMCDGFRCRSSESLHVLRLEALAEQRWWHLRELAITAVLDERGQIDDTTAGKDGTTTRTARRKRRTAAKLKRQPKVAEAAAKGKLSPEQLDKVTELAGDDDPEADRLWAEQGPRWSPEDLADAVRRQRKPTPEDAAARRAARELRYWWNRDSGMLDGRFSLPDVDGATFELVLNQMIEDMRPAPGQRWETREHRGADALMLLVEAYRSRNANETTTVPGAHLHVEVPLTGPATVAGIPLPDSMVEKLRTSARIEPHLVDERGNRIVIGRSESVVSAKMRRAVLLRDGKCRIDGCDVRGPLDVHHLIPRSWGGTDTMDNLAAVCKGGTGHHGLLAPHGPYILLGNPNRPDGLVLLRVADLPALAQLAAEQARNNPAA